jgi:hypothetical protein
MPVKRGKVVIACGIFADELSAVIQPDKNIEIRRIEAALHADPKELKKNLVAMLSECRRDGKDTYVLFGNCHPEIDELCRIYGAKRLESDNCIHAFLGSSKDRFEQDRTMIMTPAWVREWRSIMNALGWDEVDARINLGRYRRILLLDPELRSLTDEEILEFYDLIQVPIEIERLELDTFKQTVERLLDT